MESHWLTPTCRVQEGSRVARPGIAVLHGLLLQAVVEAPDQLVLHPRIAVPDADGSVKWLLRRAGNGGPCYIVHWSPGEVAQGNIAVPEAVPSPLGGLAFPPKDE